MTDEEYLDEIARGREEILDEIARLVRLLFSEPYAENKNAARIFLAQAEQLIEDLEDRSYLTTKAGTEEALLTAKLHGFLTPAAADLLEQGLIFEADEEMQRVFESGEFGSDTLFALLTEDDA